MIDEKKVARAVRTFCKNPYWKKVYEEAPSPLSRRYFALSFYYSEYFYGEDGRGIFENGTAYADYNEEEEGVFAKMNADDWRYLQKHCGHNPFVTKCRDMIEKLEGGER